MKKLILVRHAKTQANDLGKLTGHSETILSKEGQVQVKKLSAYLCKYKIDSIYSSPMQRCLETVSDIAKRASIPIKVIDDFREINFGIFENHTFGEIKGLYPKEVDKMLKEGHTYIYPEGESVIDSYKRNIRAIELVLDGEEGQNILICAHAGTIRNLLSYFVISNYQAHWHFQIDNASVTIVEITDGFPVIKVMNNIDY